MCLHSHDQSSSLAGKRCLPTKTAAGATFGQEFTHPEGVLLSTLNPRQLGLLEPPACRDYRRGTVSSSGGGRFQPLKHGQSQGYTALPPSEVHNLTAREQRCTNRG